MKKQFIESGEIVSTHGIKGEVRIYPWCDTPDFLTGFKRIYLKNGEQELKVQKIYAQKAMVVASFKGVETIEDAVKLRGQKIYLNRDDIKLEAGQYLVQDLIGMTVVDVDTGEEYGKLVEVSSTGANDVYQISGARGLLLVPSIPQVVIDRNFETNVISIRPLDGLFD